MADIFCVRAFVCALCKATLIGEAVALGSARIR